MLRRLIFAAATMAVAAVTMFGLTGGTAAAAPGPPTYITNHNGLCLDIGSNAPGTPIGITGCYKADSQLWFYSLAQ